MALFFYDGMISRGVAFEGVLNNGELAKISREQLGALRPVWETNLVNPDFSIGPMTLDASVGDQVVVTIESVEQTVSRCVVLRQGSQDPNTYCN